MALVVVPIIGVWGCSALKSYVYFIARRILTDAGIANVTISVRNDFNHLKNEPDAFDYFRRKDDFHGGEFSKSLGDNPIVITIRKGESVEVRSVLLNDLPSTEVRRRDEVDFNTCEGVTRDGERPTEMFYYNVKVW